MNKYEQNVNEELHEVERLEDIEELEDLLFELDEACIEEQMTEKVVVFAMQHPCVPVEQRYHILKNYSDFVSRTMNWSEEMVLQQAEKAKKMMKELIKNPKTDKSRLLSIFMWGYDRNPTSEELIEMLLHPNLDGGDVLFYALDERFDELDVVEALIKKGAMMNSSILLERIAKKLMRDSSNRPRADRIKLYGEIITYKEDDYSNENLWMKAFYKYVHRHF